MKVQAYGLQGFRAKAEGVGLRLPLRGCTYYVAIPLSRNLIEFAQTGYPQQTWLGLRI